jgi:hypothetical protein
VVDSLRYLRETNSLRYDSRLQLNVGLLEGRNIREERLLTRDDLSLDWLMVNSNDLWLLKRRRRRRREECSLQKRIGLLNNRLSNRLNMLLTGQKVRIGRWRNSGHQRSKSRNTL